MRILFFYLILLSSLRAESPYYFDCGKTKESLRMIQENILKDKNASGEKYADMQKQFDKSQAKLVLYKGLMEIKNSYWLSFSDLKKKVDEKGLDKAEKATKKTIIAEETLDHLKKNNKQLDLEQCPQKNTLICLSFTKIGSNTLREERRTTIGLIRNLRFVDSNESVIEDLKRGFQNFPSLQDRKESLRKLEELKFELKAMRDCKIECDKKQALLDEKKRSFQKQLKVETKKIQQIKNQEKVGNLSLLKNNTKLLNSKKASDNLVKRIKSSYIHAQLRAKLREKTRSKKDQDIFKFNIKDVYQNAFKDLGCKGQLTSNNINTCIEKQQHDSSLDKLIGQEEANLSKITEKINSLTKSPSHQDMINLKDSLISYNLHNCKETKKDGANKNFTICDPPKGLSNLSKIAKFALDTGEVVAYLDDEKKIHGNIKTSTHNVMKICSTPSNAKAVESLKVLLCPKQALKLSKKRREKNRGTKRKSSPREKKEFNWAGLYANNYVQRDDYGRIISIVKKPTTADYLMPNLLRSMNEMAPVGAYYLGSQGHLDVMAEQAKQQNIINSYRATAPLHTKLWDLGYRGFDSKYIGGPTPWFPGTTGIGALGRTHTFGGMGVFVPYGGQYGGRWIHGQLNPLNYSTFQFGAQYTYGQ